MQLPPQCQTKSRAPKGRHKKDSLSQNTWLQELPAHYQVYSLLVDSGNFPPITCHEVANFEQMHYPHLFDSLYLDTGVG